MKIIGRGWQYTVCDIGNNRVLKKYNTRIQAYFVMLRENFPYIDYPIWKFPKYYKGCRDTALDSIKKIKETKLDLVFFGNPKILNELDYEQDKVIPLHDYFKGLNFTKGRHVIDKFIEFNQMLLEKKMIDKSFLIGKNYGINSHGEIILTDIGELYSSEESIRKQIKKKPWNDPYVTSTLPNKELRDYFVTKMNLSFK